jgi:hypothetical protein
VCTCIPRRSVEMRLSPYIDLNHRAFVPFQLKANVQSREKS